jgi:hypothetical protein
MKYEKYKTKQCRVIHYFYRSSNDGHSITKAYFAIGHTNGIEGDLPDSFVAQNLVNQNFFTLMSSDLVFVQFIDDGSFNIDLLQDIIKANQITYQIITTEFGTDRIQLSAFIQFLQ